MLAPSLLLLTFMGGLGWGVEYLRAHFVALKVVGALDQRRGGSGFLLPSFYPLGKAHLRPPVTFRPTFSACGLSQWLTLAPT